MASVPLPAGKKEKIEEKRINTAIDALALVYESTFVFDSIRNEMYFESEWRDMPEGYDRRGARGPFFAVLKRIAANRDFFERAWKMLVRYMTLFGPDVEQTFFLMHRARRNIEISAEMLFHDPEPAERTPDNIETWGRFRADVWPAFARRTKEGHRVGAKLTEFKTKMENLCRPIIDRQYGKAPRKGIIGRISDGFGLT